MTKRDNGGDYDDRELGLFWSGLNRLGEVAARTYHQTALAMDRVIRRLETPAPDMRRRIEPGFGETPAPARAQRGNGVVEALITVDGLTIEANAEALKAIARFNPEDADGADLNAVRDLAGSTARASEHYLAVAADTLDLTMPLTDAEPVWASGLERRFAAVIAAAEALMARGEKAAAKAVSKNRPGV